MTPFKGRNRVTSPYGYRNIGRGNEWHAGQDIVGDDGWEIRAIWDAVRCEVARGYSGGRGNYVVLYYSESLRVYCQHMGDIYVQHGQSVKQGQTIGLMGNTGDSTGAHLHIEVQQFSGGAWHDVNPAQYTEVPNFVGTQLGNDDLDTPSAQDTVSEPSKKYRLYQSTEAHKSKADAMASYEAHKEGHESEFVLCAVGDGKWRIGRVYLATENMRHALANLVNDCILCGSDFTKHRIYNVVSANSTMETAIKHYASVAENAPNDMVLSNMGADGNWRCGASVFATKSLSAAMKEMTIDQILC